MSKPNPYLDDDCADLVTSTADDVAALVPTIERMRDGDIDAMPEVVEHVGGIIESIGEARPYIEEPGKREELATEIVGGVLREAGVKESGPAAEIIVSIAKGLVRLWRRRRDARGGSRETRVPRMGSVQGGDL